MFSYAQIKFAGEKVEDGSMVPNVCHSSFKMYPWLEEDVCVCGF